MSKLNKEEFMALELRSRLDVVNKVLQGLGTKGISNEFDFSYGWLVKKLKEQGAVYVQADKKFVLSEIDNFTNEEVIVVREMINKYRNNKIEVIDDIRLVAGVCKEEITRSFTIDKEVNDEWTSFCKSIKGVTSKDLVTAALKAFIERYKND